MNSKLLKRAYRKLTSRQANVVRLPSTHSIKRRVLVKKKKKNEPIQRPHSPIIIFTNHRGVKIQIVRTDIELLSLKLLSAIFILLSVHTYQIKFKFEAYVTDDL